MIKNYMLSENFSIKEFNYVIPEIDLLKLLQYTRNIVGKIIITDSTRTIEEHISIYKNKYGDKWLENIPWNSKHLAIYNKGLRAVDIKAVDNKGEVFSARLLSEIIKKTAEKFGIVVGIGVSNKHFVHVDVREKYTEWKYDNKY